MMRSWPRIRPLTLAMTATPSQRFTLNGADYDSSQLSPEGQRLLNLITEAQSEMGRLDTQKTLLQMAQQQLINQLKPLLPPPIPSQPAGAVGVLGHASDRIPTTPVDKPEQEPAPFPETIPEAIRGR